MPLRAYVPLCVGCFLPSDEVEIAVACRPCNPPFEEKNAQDPQKSCKLLKHNEKKMKRKCSATPRTTPESTGNSLEQKKIQGYPLKF